MTVADLIAALSPLPPDSPVVYSDNRRLKSVDEALAAYFGLTPCIRLRGDTVLDDPDRR